MFGKEVAHEKIILLIILSSSAFAAVLLSEDWESATSGSWPNTPKATYNGWTTADYTEGEGYAEISTTRSHSGSKSLYMLKQAGENFVKDQSKTFPATTEARMRFYIYFDSDYANLETGGEDYVHLIFYQTAISFSGVRMDILPYVNKAVCSSCTPNPPYTHTWPPTCNSGKGYIGISSPAGTGETFYGVTKDRSDLCFGIKDNLNRWVKVEWAYKINSESDGRVSLWIDDVQLMKDELLPPDSRYMSINKVILSGYMSTNRNYKVGYYIDDIIITDDYDTPIDGGSVELYCGDESCNNGETCSTCPEDCGSCQEYCGDDGCSNEETCTTCPEDCGSCTCTSNWLCTAWSNCANGVQTRTCTDGNSCGISTGKPLESQTCTVGSIVLFHDSLISGSSILQSDPMAVSQENPYDGAASLIITPTGSWANCRMYFTDAVISEPGQELEFYINPASSVSGQFHVWVDGVQIDSIDFSAPGGEYSKVSYELPDSGSITEIMFGANWPVTYIDEISIGKHHYDADTDESGCVELDELIVYMNQWKAGSKELSDVMGAINAWKVSC